MNKLLACLGFSYFLGIGPLRFKALLSKFSDPVSAFQAKKEELKAILGEVVAERFLGFRETFDPEKEYKNLKTRGIEVIDFFSQQYPEQLKTISDPPICLYIKGDPRILKKEKLPLLAIVGTRKPTPYGVKVTQKIAFELAQAGLVVVSGMAFGIDAEAHWAVLKADGKTVAVLGCGVEVVYPAGNWELYQNIIQKNGAVISEFPPKHIVARGLFIARNRIISGLADGVLVVEGGKDSGSLITARYAAEQGREVFAVPAPITSDQSQAPNSLLKQGAKLVAKVDDILEELGLRILAKKQIPVTQTLKDQEEVVYNLLMEKPLFIEEIINLSGLSPEELSRLLLALEVKGVIKKAPSGQYQTI